VYRVSWQISHSTECISSLLLITVLVTDINAKPNFKLDQHKDSSVEARNKLQKYTGPTANIPSLNLLEQAEQL